MRKIDKDTILSKECKDWLDGLEKDKHPKYNSSANKYYFDIKMSLLHCQGGLCAYTEQRLCNEELLELENWDELKYNRKLTKLEISSIQGDLEHFDESLKKNNAWLWSNLFVISTHVNCRIKGTKAIKNILKPDCVDYEPNKYLQFDYEVGLFMPNINLSGSDKEDVEYMIETLGINCIYTQRKKRLKEWKDREELGLPVEADEYVTAWSMVKE